MIFILAKPPPNPNFAQQPMASILKAGLQPAQRPPATLPPIRYATAAAAAVAPPVPPTPLQPPTSAPLNPLSVATTAPSIAPSTSQSTSQDQQSGLSSSPSLTHPSVTSPMLSSASVSHQPDGSFYSGQESPAMSEAEPSSSSGAAPVSFSPDAPRKGAFRFLTSSLDLEVIHSPASLSSPPISAAQPPSVQQLLSEQPSIPHPNGSSQSATGLQAPLTSGPSPLPQQVQQYPLTSPDPTTSATVPNPQQQPQPQFPPGVKVPQSEQGMLAPQQTIGTQRPPSTTSQQQQSGRPTSTFPGSLSDLVVSFENVKQKGMFNG
jgi:CCR4-NOT transcription complex subunit 3